MALSNVVACTNQAAKNGKSTYGFATVAWVTDATGGYATVHVAAYVGSTLSSPMYYYNFWGKAYINDTEKSSTTKEPNSAGDWKTDYSFSWGGVSFIKSVCVAAEATERIYYGYGVTSSAKVSMQFYSPANDTYTPPPNTYSSEAWVTLPYQAPPVSTPTLSNPSISNRTTTSAASSFSVTNDGGASIVDNYQDLSLTNFGTVIQTLSTRNGTFTNLTPGTTYYVRANASNGTYRGYSSVVSFTTIHAAPTNVSISPEATGQTTINLHRAFTGATYCQYNINNLGWISEGSSYSSGITVNADLVSGLTKNTTYSCQIRMGNSDSDLTYSNTVSVTTWDDAPTDLAISNVTSYWKDISSAICISGTVSATSTSAITNYTLYYKRSIDSNYTSVNLGTSTTFELTNLQESTAYDIYFTATNNGGTATLATPVTETTLSIHNIKVSVDGANFIPLVMYFNVSNGTWKLGSFKVIS